MEDGAILKRLKKFIGGKDLDSLNLRDAKNYVFKKLGKVEKERVKVLLVALLNEQSETKKPNPFNQEQVLSEVLAELVGAKLMSRPQVVKSIWNYIKLHDLQDPSDRREILCDEKMFNVFKRKKMHMFKMNKLLSYHIQGKDEIASFGVVPEEDDEEVKDEKPKRKRSTKNRGSKSKALKTEDDEKKVSSFQKPIKISDSLAEFLGGGVRMAARTQVVKQLWAYIKEHDLQDPQDKRKIICDATLEGLMGQKEITSFSMNKYIQQHFLK